MKARPEGLFTNRMYHVIFETMNPISKKTTSLLAVALFLTCVSASAQRHRRHHHRHYPQRIVTVAARPTTTVHISNRFDQKERLRMAIAYLASNQYLTIKQYAKMTGLSKNMAEAELDAFACDEKKPITSVVTDKKKLYTRS